jgi:hypothetical protein
MGPDFGGARGLDDVDGDLKVPAGTPGKVDDLDGHAFFSGTCGEGEVHELPDGISL